jgi:hypothetical protein
MCIHIYIGDNSVETVGKVYLDNLPLLVQVYIFDMYVYIGIHI